MLSVSLYATVLKNFWIYGMDKADFLHVQQMKDVYCCCTWSRASILSIIPQDKLGQLEVF